VVLRGQEAERDAEQHGHEHRGQAQLHRGREPAADLLRHGSPRDHVVAEVERDDVLHVLVVLLVDRPVEPVLPVDLGHRLRGGPLAEQRLGGSAGQRPDEQEQEDRQADQDRHEQDQPADDEAQHLAARPSSADVTRHCRYSSLFIETSANGSSETGLGV
jgi:hypothetical protein